MARRRAAAAVVAAAAVALLLAWVLVEGRGGRKEPPRPRGTPEETRFPEAREERPLPVPAAEEEPPEPEPEPAPIPPSAPEVPEALFLLEGVVLDGLDGPVAGAVVSWGNLPPAEERGKAPSRDVFLLPRPDVFAPTSTAVSGEDGAFRLAGPPRDRVLLTASVPGGRVEPFGPFLFEGNRRGVVLRVAPAMAVTGIVLRPPARGSWPEEEEPPPPAPEPGARVVAWWSSPYEGDRPPRFEEAVADGEGRFRIEGVPPGACTVEARASDGERASVRRPEGGGEDLRLLLGHPARWEFAPFEGAAFLSDGRTPAAGARVEVQSSAAPAGEAPLTATCAEDGSFSVPAVPWQGPSVDCPLGVTVDAGTRGVARVAVRSWPRSGAERIVLWPPSFRTVAGVAVAVDGEGSPPMPGLPLLVRSWHESPRDPRIRIAVANAVRTRADGTFALPGQGARGITVTVPPGAAPFEVARVLEEGDGLRVEVVPACTLEGTVRTGEGEFVEGALCTWSGTDSVLTDGEGRFRFHPVPGNLPLVVTVRAPGWNEARSLPVTVPRGGSVRDLVVVLDARAVALSGRVVDGAGAPLRLARVEATPSGREPHPWTSAPGAWTDGEGRWRIEVPPGGTWRVTASSPRYRSDFEDGVEGGAVRDLRLVSAETGR